MSPLNGGLKKTNSMDLEYTQVVKVTAVAKDNKKVNTQYGEKETFSFKTSEDVWYTSWDTDIKADLISYSASGTDVLIGYTKRMYNGKEYRTAKQVIVQGKTAETPQETPKPNKDASIARAVALKAAVELICAGQGEASVFTMADKLLGWLEGKPEKEITEEFDMEDIPF